MTSAEVLDFQGRLYHNQQICFICQTPITTQNKWCTSDTEGMLSCSSKCLDIMSRSMWAFVQGFLISCVLCLSEESESETKVETVLCEHDSVSQPSYVETSEQGIIKNESVGVGVSPITVMDDKYSLMVRSKYDETQISETDLDTITTSVHFRMNIVNKPSPDGHTVEFLTEHASAMVNENEEVLQGFQSVSDQNSLASPAFDCNFEQPINNKSTSLGTSRNTDEISLSKEVNCCNGVDFLHNGENVALSSSEMQQNFCKGEVSVSNVMKSEKILNNWLKPNSDNLNITFKRQQNKHRCSYCSKSFCNKHYLSRHIKSHSTDGRLLQEESRQTFTCEFCAQVFAGRYSLKAHIRRKHSGEEPMECDVCGKVQPGSYALRAHKKACHDFRSLCHICGAEFSGRTSFDKHMAGHEGIKRYFCDICGAGFVHNSSLNNHSSVHLSTKSYQCDICSQMFKAQYLLNEHLLKTHQCGPSIEHRIRGLKKMGVEVDKDAISKHANQQCLVCSELLVDGRCVSHPDNSQEVFHCSACGDMTSNIVLFYQHVKWHKGMLLSHNRCTNISVEASVGCHLSGSGSGATATLIKCEVCSRTFKNFEYLSAHMHQHREPRFVCDICNKRFTYKCNLKTHMSTHLDTWPFECEDCHKKFRDKYAFRKHQLKHKEPQFKCQVCGKALTRRPYLIKHYQKVHPEYQGNMQL